MKLWPRAPRDFAARLRFLFCRLKLETMPFTSACLRAGGATYWFNRGVKVHRLKCWGRWASERSLNHYLQEAYSALMLLRLNSTLLALPLRALPEMAGNESMDATMECAKNYVAPAGPHQGERLGQLSADYLKSVA